MPGINVDILLSVYNGEQYLATQLDSIIAQDFKDWKLIIRDDGSTDGSLAIIRDCQEKYSDKVVLINDTKGNVGYTESYTLLLKESKAPYIMFCDQDDVWYRNKVAALLSLLRQNEEDRIKIPLLVASDMDILDGFKENRGTFHKQYRYYKDGYGQQVFFLKNYFTGCSMLFNRELVELAFKTTNYVGLHDYWLLLVCATIGKVGYYPNPLMQYRLHNNNAIGIQPDAAFSIRQFVNFMKRLWRYGKYNIIYKNLFKSNRQQIENIYNVYNSQVNNSVEEFVNFNSFGFMKRKFINCKTPFIIQRSWIDRLTYLIFY